MNTIVKWEEDAGNILYVNELWNPSDTLPNVGDIITRPFLIDSETHQRLPFLVVEIQEHVGIESCIYVVVVSRLGQFQ